MNETMTRIEEFHDAFVDISAVYGLDLLQAIIILCIGYWLAGKFSNGMRRWLDRFERVDDTLKPLFASLVR